MRKGGKGAKMRLHVGVSQGKKKRKLSSGPGEDDLAPPAAKKPKVFTHSAAEMVKIMGQYLFYLFIYYYGFNKNIVIVITLLPLGYPFVIYKRGSLSSPIVDLHMIDDIND